MCDRRQLARECLKKFVQSCPEPCQRKGRSLFDARSVLSVREYDKRATCLRVAAFSLRSYFGEGGPAKAGNAAGDFFQHSLWRFR